MNFDYCNGTIYVIKQGDTLYSISRKYNVPLAMILRSNPYADIYNLKVGDEICIPQTQPMTNCVGQNCTSNPMQNEPNQANPELNPNMPMQPAENNMKQQMASRRSINSFAISSPGETNGNTPISQLKPATPSTSRIEGEGNPRTDETVWTKRQAQNTFEEEQVETMNLNSYPKLRGKGNRYSSNIPPRPANVIPKEPGPVNINPVPQPVPGNPAPQPVSPVPGNPASQPVPPMPVNEPPVPPRPVPQPAIMPGGQMPRQNGMPYQHSTTMPDRNVVSRENLISYVIRNGDTIQSILNYFSITMDELFMYNRPGTILLKEGYVIQIPASKLIQEEY